jgi:hypothetical protein
VLRASRGVLFRHRHLRVTQLDFFRTDHLQCPLHRKGRNEHTRERQRLSLESRLDEFSSKKIVCSQRTVVNLYAHSALFPGLLSILEGGGVF